MLCFTPDEWLSHLLEDRARARLLRAASLLDLPLELLVLLGELDKYVLRPSATARGTTSGMRTPGPWS